MKTNDLRLKVTSQIKKSEITLEETIKINK